MTTPIYSANGSPNGGNAGNGLVPYAMAAAMAPVAPELTFNERQIDLINRLVAPGCTQDEMALFLEVCRSTGLNPLMRQIYAIKRKQRGDDGESASRMTIQTGIDGYRLLASRTGALAGIEEATFDTEDGKHPNRASVTVYRLVAGQRVPFTATARWREYAALGRDGNPIAMWAKMPWLMLGKCAEALALRRAFPAELSGVYTAEEMAQADNPPTAYVEASVEPATQPRQTSTPKRASAAPAPAPAPKATWRALGDADVLDALNRMDIRGREAAQAFLATVKAEMENLGLAWTRDQVLDHLRTAYATDEVVAVDEAGIERREIGMPG